MEPDTKEKRMVLCTAFPVQIVPDIFPPPNIVDFPDSGVRKLWAFARGLRIVFCKTRGMAEKKAWGCLSLYFPIIL